MCKDKGQTEDDRDSKCIGCGRHKAHGWCISCEWGEPIDPEPMPETDDWRHPDKYDRY